MNVLFWGTPQYAVPTLEALLAAGHTIVGVVTQPDRRRGRGPVASSHGSHHHRSGIDGVAVQWPLVVGGADVWSPRRVAPVVRGR